LFFLAFILIFLIHDLLLVLFCQSSQLYAIFMKMSRKNHEIINDKLKTEAVPRGCMFDASGEDIIQIDGTVSAFFFAEGVNQ
jgi:hypothetical protein